MDYIEMLGTYQLEIPYEKALQPVEKSSRFFSFYFDEAFDQDRLIERAREDLSGVECFDTFVGTGLSGSLVVPVLAHEFGKDFAIVRKGREGSHSYNMVEGKLGHRWVFVDDFVSTGKTAQMVDERIKEAAGNRKWETKRVGSYLYAREGWVPCRGDRLCTCWPCNQSVSYRAYRDTAKDRYGIDVDAA